jgi:hypothetical protein
VGTDAGVVDGIESAKAALAKLAIARAPAFLSALRRRRQTE